MGDNNSDTISNNQWSTRKKVWAGLIIGCSAALLVHFTVLLPWMSFWGTTAAERNMTLPGDDWIPNPKSEMTRAITIDASPAEVWQWVIQIGGDKAGWYSLTWAENLFGMGIYNTYELRPEWQQFEEGGVVLFNELGHVMDIVEVVPEKYFVLTADSRSTKQYGKAPYPNTGTTVEMKQFSMLPDGVDAWGFWTFYLDELPDGKTRLIQHWRGDWTDSLIMDIGALLMLDVPHSVMEIEMAKQFKAVTEGRLTASANTALPKEASQL